MNFMPSKLRLKVHNLHCSGCEVTIERKFKTIPGVKSVRVSHVTGRADIVTTGERQPPLREFEHAIKADGYSVSRW